MELAWLLLGAGAALLGFGLGCAIGVVIVALMLRKG